MGVASCISLPPPPGFLGFAQKKEEVCSIRINRYLCDVSMRLSGQNPVGRSSKSSRAILTENLVFSVLFCQCFPKVRVKCMIQCCLAVDAYSLSAEQNQDFHDFA